MRREGEASGGNIKFILCADDLPAGPVNDTVYFLLSFEGGKPLEGRLEYLCSFYQLGLRPMQITWNARNELADGVREEQTTAG
jgi:microsomal dipeptidase-like Zn-dependent dipeptidase